MKKKKNDNKWHTMYYDNLHQKKKYCDKFELKMKE